MDKYFWNSVDAKTHFEKGNKQREIAPLNSSYLLNASFWTLKIK